MEDWKLEENEKAFADLLLKDFNIDEFNNSYEFVNNFISKNFTRERITELLDEDSMLKKDAHHNFRTIWMSRIFNMKHGIDDNALTVSGERPTMHQVYANNVCSFNPRLKLIDIDDNIFELINKTKNSVFPRRMPFDYLFINKIIKITDKIYCFGIMVIQAKTESEDGIGNFITLLGYDYNDGTEWRMCLSITEQGIGFGKAQIFDVNVQSEVNSKVLNIFCNVMDIMNHPDVETKIIRWFNNENRIKKGKLPIPDRINIEIKGKLYKYIYEEYPTQKEIHKSPNYSFEVRGHYIHFWNKKRWKRIYQLSLEDIKKRGYQMDNDKILSKWILPYIKGKGILKNKPYKLK